MLSSLLSLGPGSMAAAEDTLRRVKEGEEYELPNYKARQGRGLQLDNSIEEEEFKDCKEGTSGAESLHQFTTEDIEKANNVSLSQYQGQVLLVVNLASF